PFPSETGGRYSWAIFSFELCISYDLRLVRGRKATDVGLATLSLNVEIRFQKLPVGFVELAETDKPAFKFIFHLLLLNNSRTLHQRKANQSGLLRHRCSWHGYGNLR